MTEAKSADTIKAAEAGDANAQCELAMMYEHGIGVPKDFQEAFRWYSASAGAGNGFAAYKIAGMVEAGSLKTVDPADAHKWVKRAAECGLPEAQYKLAMMLESGRGIAANPGQAAHWYEQASNQGVIDAGFRLGVLYENGSGVRKDFKKAAECYEKAAKSNHAGAQYNLAVLYVTGNGVQENVGEAARLFEMSAAAGHRGAKEKLDRAARLKSASFQQLSAEPEPAREDAVPKQVEEQTVETILRNSIRPSCVMSGFVIVCAFTPVGDFLMSVLKLMSLPLMLPVFGVLLVGGLAFIGFFNKKVRVDWSKFVVIGLFAAVAVLVLAFAIYGKWEITAPGGSAPASGVKYKKLTPTADMK